MQCRVRHAEGVTNYLCFIKTKKIWGHGITRLRRNVGGEFAPQVRFARVVWLFGQIFPGEGKLGKFLVTSFL